MENKKVLTILNLALCMLSLALIYILLPYGVNNCDEPCLILQTQSTDKNFLVPLSFFVSKIIVSLFGYKWIAYRTLSVSIFVLSIIISCVYYYRRIENINKTLFICWLMLLVYALQKDNWYSIYGYDCYSMLCTTLYAIAALYYIQKPCCKILIALGALSVVNMFFRFPNLTGIPLIIALIIIRNIIEDKKSVRKFIIQIFTYLIVALMTLIISCVIIFGSFSSYIELFHVLNVKGHGSNIFISCIYQFFIKVIPYLSYMASIYMLFVLAIKYNALHKRRAYALNSLILICSMLEIVLLWRLLFISKPVFFVSACMVLILYAAIHNTKGVLDLLSIIFLLGCGFITTFGSDGGLVKYMIFSMVPLVAVYVPKYNLPFRLSASTVYLAILFISIATINKGTFVDAGLPMLNSKINHPFVNEFITSDAQAQILNKAIQDFGGYASMDNVETTVVGKDRRKYIYDYLFGCQNLHLKDVWDDADYYNDDITVGLIEKDIQQSQKDYYIFFLKSGNDSKMEKMLDRISIRDKETEAYRIYVHNPER